MTYNILFAIVGIGLIALGISLVKLDNLIESWRVETLHHTKLLNDLDNKRFEDSCRLSRAYERIQVLEERLEGQEALTSELEFIWHRLEELDKRFYEWRDYMLKHDKYFTDIEWKRVDDLTKLAALEQRVRTLEERLEAQASELTEHHNKIDTLEINGSVYEGLFEQQGLWLSRETAEHLANLEKIPEFHDPEDEGIII